mmetsp:Transcript_19214/g.47129  ORF Transcript_19214/g.47129 Transcript_19214/m.47129 type:complete len:202 (+) Transcript_19214:29-634(+)
MCPLYTRHKIVAIALSRALFAASRRSASSVSMRLRCSFPRQKACTSAAQNSRRFRSASCIWPSMSSLLFSMSESFADGSRALRSSAIIWARSALLMPPSRITATCSRSSSSSPSSSSSSSSPSSSPSRAACAPSASISRRSCACSAAAASSSACCCAAASAFRRFSSSAARAASSAFFLASLSRACKARKSSSMSRCFRSA